MKTKEEIKDDLIKDHLFKFIGQLFLSSAEHFLATGKPSGSFRQSLHEMLDSYASHLSERVKELEDKHKIELSNYAYQMDMAKRERDKAEARIKELESQQQPVKEEWISVKERLPIPYESILVYDPSFKEPYWVDYFTGTTYGNCNNMPPTVTHWQPLPSPPNQNVKE